jgi:hypothetical protein
MHPEQWQMVGRVLICVSHLGNREIPVAPILDIVCSNKSVTGVWLLTVDPEGSELVPVHINTRQLLQQKALFCRQGDYLQLIELLQSIGFDAAIMLTLPNHSPFSLAYLCYLAGIPIRIGQSQEFGGGVLSLCVQPPAEPVSLLEYNLHLLKVAGFPTINTATEAIA